MQLNPLGYLTNAVKGDWTVPAAISPQVAPPLTEQKKIEIVGVNLRYDLNKIYKCYCVVDVIGDTGGDVGLKTDKSKVATFLSMRQGDLDDYLERHNDLEFTREQWDEMKAGWEVIEAAAERQHQIDTLNGVYRSHKDGNKPLSEYDQVRHTPPGYREAVIRFLREKIEDVQELKDDLEFMPAEWQAVIDLWNGTDDENIPF